MSLHPEHKSSPNIKDVARWVGRHWKPVGLSVATLAGAGYSLTRIVQAVNPQFLDQSSGTSASATSEPPSKLEPQSAAALGPIPPEVLIHLYVLIPAVPMKLTVLELNPKK